MLSSISAIHMIGGVEIVVPSITIETIPDHPLLIAKVPFQVVDFLNVRPSCCFNSAFLSNACFLASSLSSASTASGEWTLRYALGAGTTWDEMDLHISSSLWKTCLDEALLISGESTPRASTTSMQSCMRFRNSCNGSEQLGCA